MSNGLEAVGWIGVDLGQRRDFSAIAVLERVWRRGREELTPRRPLAGPRQPIAGAVGNTYRGIRLFAANRLHWV